jgi:hypothetical protein
MIYFYYHYNTKLKSQRQKWVSSMDSVAQMIIHYCFLKFCEKLKLKGPNEATKRWVATSRAPHVPRLPRGARTGPPPPVVPPSMPPVLMCEVSLFQ